MALTQQRRVNHDAFVILTTLFFTLFLVSLLPSFSQLKRHSSIRTAHIPSETTIQRQQLSNLQRQTTSSGSEEPEANIAYFIQISQSTAGHLPRLLKRLYHEENVYGIHFDSKMDDFAVNSVKNTIFAENPHFLRNVHIMPSELITYRGVSMVLNTVNAMKFLLELDPNWDYFINISGSDYPLVSPQLQRKLLGKHVDKQFNFATFSAPERWPLNIDYRMAHFYVDEALSFKQSESAVLQSEQRNPLSDMMNFKYVNAEAWMINSRDFCSFVVTDGYARKMLLTFAFSVEPSEHYFASLLWNHPKYNRTIVERAMRHVIWTHEGEDAGQHPFLVDEVLSDGSYRFQKVVEISPNFFIRKFKKANSPLMDMIDLRLEEPLHLKEVRNLYDWVTGKAVTENDAKAPLD